MSRNDIFEKKKTILCIVLIIAMTIFAGCGNSEEDAAAKEPAANDTAFLASTEHWWFYDEVTGEYEKMSFSEDGTFYWGCECGEPIGNSDIYDRYAYDDKTNAIRLYNESDEDSMELKVLDYSQYHLLLEVDGEIKDYTYLNSNMDIENAEEYVGGYNMYAWFLESDGKEAVIGPYNYDGDIEYPDNAMKAYPISENAEFYDLQIKSVLKVEEDEKISDVSYEKLTRDEGLARLEGDFGFIWFDNEMRIEKVTYYGELCIQE